MTQFTYPSGRVLNPTYDSKGRFYSLLSYLSSVTYDTIGRTSGMTLGNGVVESFGYDAQRMQLTSQTATKSGQTRLSLTCGFQAAAGQMGARMKVQPLEFNHGFGGRYPFMSLFVASDELIAFYQLCRKVCRKIERACQSSRLSNDPHCHPTIEPGSREFNPLFSI
jgi:YD repeat-containing protein